MKGASRRAAVNVIRVAVVTNVIPHYRSGFYRRLFQRADLDVRVFCQASLPGMNLSLAHDQFREHVTLVPFHGRQRERFGWQWLPWRTLLSSFDVLFVPGNPRVVSNVVLAGMARSLRRPLVIWGQAHTAGARRSTERLRLWWLRGFDHLFVYTDGEVRWLQARGFDRHCVVGMNNGLDQRGIDQAAAEWHEEALAVWREQQGIAGRTTVLSCSRLEQKNRYDLWLAAMPAVVARHPQLQWCVIGDGPERGRLEARARELGVAGHVRWLGPIYDERALAPWFLTSRLLVHPSAIGLTLLHAFGYGLPVVTHDDAASQMPEFDAFEPGETGLLYRLGDVVSLGEAVCRCLADETARRHMSARARQIARDQYNVDVMVERFSLMARHAASRTRAAPA